MNDIVSVPVFEFEPDTYLINWDDSNPDFAFIEVGGEFMNGTENSLLIKLKEYFVQHKVKIVFMTPIRFRMNGIELLPHKWLVQLNRFS
ncbi:TPA: hypothetical protein DF272_00110 [Candidatus Falkowbacteria bacterium]|nr:hypothetical protein [Candidatus Falkowbacteria bacterium]